MLSREKFKKNRQRICALLGAILTAYYIHKGAENNGKTVFVAVATSMCVYFIWHCIDRIIGILFPVVVDLRNFESDKVDRSDPYHIIICPGSCAPEIELEIGCDERVELLKIGDLKMRQSDREYCYLRITNKRFIKADPDMAYTITEMIKTNFGKVQKTGISYLVDHA